MESHAMWLIYKAQDILVLCHCFFQGFSGKSAVESKDVSSRGFPGGPVVKNLSSNAGDASSILGVGN